MKMKTVFLVLLAAALVLSLTGVAAAAESKVTINNKTLSSVTGNSIAVPVNITLNLANDYVVTIPADFSLTTVDLANNQRMYTTDRETPPFVDVDVLLLGANQYINISIEAQPNYYNDTYDAGFTGEGYTKGGWVLMDQASNKLHYAISNGSAYLTGSGYDAHGKFSITTNSEDNFISHGESIAYTNKSVDVPINVAVMDKPKVVAEYTSMLKFVVKLEGSGSQTT